MGITQQGMVEGPCIMLETDIVDRVLSCGGV